MNTTEKKTLIITTMILAFLAAGIFSLVKLGKDESSVTKLKLSHQWANTDIRHKVVELLASEVKNADVNLSITIYPSQSLFKAREQYRPLTRGRIDIIVLPLSYAAGQHSEFNLTLMPGLVKNHNHAERLAASPFMKELEDILLQDNVKVLVHGYLAGGFASKEKCITNPKDLPGVKIRSAGAAFDEMLAAAGGSIASMSSSELYSGLQTGVLDAANTSSSSFVSYRIYEQANCYTPPGNSTLWFMYQPLLMNNDKFNSLTQAQQNALLNAAKKAQAYYKKVAILEDTKAIEIFRSKGVEIVEMSETDFADWKEVAQKSSYASFIKKTENGQRLLDMALSVE